MNLLRILLPFLLNKLSLSLHEVADSTEESILIVDGNEEAINPRTSLFSTSERPDVTTSVVYSIRVENGRRDATPFDNYSEQLVQIQDMLAMEVASGMWTTGGQHRRKLRDNSEDRMLTARVDSPSSVDLVRYGLRQSGFQPCPANVGDAVLDRCEEVVALLGLFVDDAENPTDIKDSFKTKITAAILNGRLREIMAESFPGSFVSILSGQQEESSPEEDIGDVSAGGNGGNTNDTTTTEEDGVDNSPASSDAPKKIVIPSEPISPGAISAIAVCTSLLLGCASAMCIFRRRRRAIGKEHDCAIQQQPTDIIDTFSVTALEWGTLDVEACPSPPTALVDAILKGSTVSVPDPPGDYPLAYSLPQNYRVAQRQEPPTDLFNISLDLSVDLDTSAISLATNDIMNGLPIIDLGDECRIMQDGGAAHGEVNLDDLEAAIFSGDWSALAATASAFVCQDTASVYSSSSKISECPSQMSRDWSLRDKSWQTEIDSTKAAELDDLIEHGNWSGIIEAAARYEAERVAQSKSTASSECYLLESVA